MSLITITITCIIRHSIGIQVLATFCTCLTAVSYGTNIAITSSVIFTFEKNRDDQITMTMEEASWIRKINSTVLHMPH